MGDFIHFTEEQKERANSVSIEDILRRKGEQLIRSGSELRWKRHDSVTIRGNCWYRHSERVGSHAIDFMQAFYNMTFPEAVTYLLDGEPGQAAHMKKTDYNNKANYSSSVSRPHRPTTPREEHPTNQAAHDSSSHSCSHADTPSNHQPDISTRSAREFILPEKNDSMKRVYAYLLHKRFITRDIISFFTDRGSLYESRKHHNAVFLGFDKEGKVRHAHQKGTFSDGNGFRINTEGSDPCYGFGHVGKSRKLFVFEAPIDFLSFITLYPKDWQKHSYIVLNGVAEHALLRMLADYPYLHQTILCLDHDAAGIEACGRLADILLENGHKEIQVLQPAFKDWNESLKQKKGMIPLPSEEHPKILECHAWLKTLKELTASIGDQYAAKEYLLRYHRGIYEKLKADRPDEKPDSSNKMSRLEEAFDSDGLFLSGIAVKCIEKYSREMGKEISADEIIDCIGKRYYPHRDKGNLSSRLSRLQRIFDETIEAFERLDGIHMKNQNAQNEKLRKGDIKSSIAKNQSNSGSIENNRVGNNKIENNKIENNSREENHIIENNITENNATENSELIIRKCMGLTMECIRAHIYITVKRQSQTTIQTMEGGMAYSCIQ